jgi:hypothetical protein
MVQYVHCMFDDNRVYAEHFTVDGRRSIFRLSKKIVCVYPTFDGRMRGINLRKVRYKSDQRNKMTIKNENEL